MNDTVRLGLLLKKLRILLLLNRFNLAEALLDEIEKMSDLLLKNKRVLLYMEEEHNLLTFYKQQFLDLKSEFFSLKAEQKGESMKVEYLEKSRGYVFEMVVAYCESELWRYLQYSSKDSELLQAKEDA